MGQRVVKEMITSGRSEYEVYSYDAGGNVLAIYSIKWVSSKYEMRLIEQPIYGSDRLGEYKPDMVITACSTCTTVTSITNVVNSSAKVKVDTTAGTSVYKAPTVITYTTGNMKRTLGKKQYEIKNHLGNVLAVILDRKMPYFVSPNTGPNIDYYIPQVVSHSDYYPFGMAITSEKRTGSFTAYRYGFNGQEKDNETYGTGNEYDFGARIYDPRLGRFFAVDPQWGSTPWNTPYSFAENTPIAGVDLDGEKLFIVINEGGKDIKLRYKNGKLYRGRKEYTGSNSFATAALRQLNWLIDNDEIAASRINELVHNRFKNYIHLVDDEHPTNEVSVYGRTKSPKWFRNVKRKNRGIKQGGDLYYDPNSTEEPLSKSPRPPEAGYMHELQHLFDLNMGNFNHLLKKDYDEYAPVGMENRIRQLMGFPLRLTYRWDEYNQKSVRMGNPNFIHPNFLGGPIFLIRLTESSPDPQDESDKPNISIEIKEYKFKIRLDKI